MGIAKPNRSAEIDQALEKDIGGTIHELTRTSGAFRQSENGDGQTSANDLSALLSQVSEGSTREIESLINELHGLRRKLETEGNRIQADIVKYAELNQGVTQLTVIISDNVKSLPIAPNINS
jgi:hypothetical protein